MAVILLVPTTPASYYSPRLPAEVTATPPATGASLHALDATTFILENYAL